MIYDAGARSANARPIKTSATRCHPFGGTALEAPGAINATDAWHDAFGISAMAPRKLSVPTVESSALPAQAKEDFDPVTSGLMYARKLTATSSLKRRDD